MRRRGALGPGSEPFAPIADFGFLSDCETTALIAPSGNVEWLCLPKIDSPSVFGSILDRDAGYFRIGPAGVEVPAAQRYIPGTMVMETTWWTRGGWLVVTDALLMGPWHHETERSESHRRAPTDYDADHVLLRKVKCVNGNVQVRMDCMPVFEYGRTPARWSYTGQGYEAAVAVGGGLSLHLTTDMNVGFEGSLATSRSLLKEGESRFVALSWSTHGAPRDLAEAESRLRWTVHHWQHWLDRGDFPDHPWRSFLQRSALTLKGLTYAPTGAVAAAATTSLPEAPGGDRNWDYRYTWIRDSTMTLWAFYTLGYDWEANDFFHFITDVAEESDGRLQIMYGVDGRSELPESDLDHLSGYDNARPVRIGNGAYTQAQHDVWGAIVGSVYLFVRKRDRLDDRLWKIVVTQVEEALLHWREPDCGMWEVRGAPQHFTSSKVFCWLAAQRGAQLARLRGADEHSRAERWQRAADEIRDDVLNNALDERGVFTAHYGAKSLDASVLLIPLLGFLPPDDKRVRETVLAICEELTEDDLVLRYRTEETDDGFASEEGTFTICSFWLVSALVMIGESERAKTLCQKLLSYASHLQLYAEEIDPHTGRHLGNFPQAFTHLALINAVMQVIGMERGQRLYPFS
ncbi:glycoside hydrolase family 15 protein [Actinocorallia sp. API 0066]|uniref:glycoside hydrolase family 15 protein n=1 Tax=Actinocorallia sp. API 0066 TaxID=2896846 RepID=UPI001E2BEBEF|nr:glycoside hydrolase family 15 protein [Actinocorallia sp. API 0066]MCD0451115.1 glycoside hydrolase family 15 protein [Actinocorallia sp. API 0066]